MAIIFAFAAMTIIESGVDKKVVLWMFAAYLLLPYRMMYSFTIWKDVLFGGFALTILVAIYRIFKEMSEGWINYLALCVSGVGLCLFRSNGFLLS